MVDGMCLEAYPSIFTRPLRKKREIVTGGEVMGKIGNKLKAH